MHSVSIISIYYRRRLQLSLLLVAGFAASLTISAQQTSAQPGAADIGAAEDAAAKSTDELFWLRVRDQFNLPKDLTYFNNGTTGPVPYPTSSVHEQWEKQLASDPRNTYRPEEIDAVRQKLARFVGALPEEIAFTHSTTEGVNIFAHGLDWKAGDEVILGSQEHHAAIDAYEGISKRYGVKVVTVHIAAPPKSKEEIIQAYASAITEHTRLIVVSHVTYISGLLYPIKELTELAHSKNIFISVDGAQSVGVIPLNLHELGVDHYAGPGQKWLLAGTGTGFTYIRKDLQDKVWPSVGNYNPSAPQPAVHTAKRYEKTGQVNISALLGIGSAIDFQTSIGQERFAARDRYLAARLKQGLVGIKGVTLYTSQDPNLSVGLTTFALQGRTPEELVKLLNDKYHIFVRTIVTDEVKGVRISTHIYNTIQEVDAVLKAIGELSQP